MGRIAFSLFVCVSALVGSFTNASGGDRYVREFDAILGPSSDGIEAWVKFALAKKGQNFKNVWSGVEDIKIDCRAKSSLSMAVSLEKKNIGNLVDKSVHKAKPVTVKIANKDYQATYSTLAPYVQSLVLLVYFEGDAQEIIRALYDGGEMAISIPEMEKTAIIWSGEKNGRAKDALGRFYQLCKDT
ncbi:hypothetical protein [Sinorhizobium medicae]|uniref:hypothetical protein n=1 Tax=Sinorhizobium medicae TaxID=110321 RepID=UPI0012957840|nr:hypothetical protein [Sinorhizobium medicae]MQX45737.1 hypothetical protein [Sinorhizobium medicae]